MPDRPRPEPSIRARIESGFERWGAWVVRRRGRVVAGCLIATGILFGGLPRLTADYANESFLQSDDTTQQIYDDFRDRFGREELILVGIRPPEVYDLGFLAKLRAFHEAIEEELPHLDEVDSLVNARVTRGEDDELIVEDLLESWPSDAAELAALRERVLGNPLYVNTLVSRDQAFTAVSIRLDTYSSRGRLSEDEQLDQFDAAPGATEEPEFLTSAEEEEAVDTLYAIIDRFRADDFEVFVVGGAVVGHRLNSMSLRDMTKFASLSIVVVVLVLWLMFRRASAAILPLVVVQLSIASALGAMGWLGIPFSTPTQVLPNLLIAVGIADAVHILAIVYARLGAGQPREDAIAIGLGHSGLAVVLTSLTTAGGLVSFLAADIRPVAELGVVAPIGVLIALFYTLTLLPALLAYTRLRPVAATREAGAIAIVDRTLRRAGDLAVGHPIAVLLSTGALLVVAAAGVAQVRFSNDSLAWLFTDDPVRVSAETVDRALEGSAGVEILIDTGHENGLYEPDVLKRIDAAMEYAESLEQPVDVGKAISIVQIVKETHRALNENRDEFYALPDERAVIAQELLLFENSGSDDLTNVTDSRFQTARLTLRVGWADGMLYGPFLKELRAGLRKILGDDLSFDVTGSTVLSSRAFSLLLTSIASSYLLALVIITPLMMLMIGDWKRGILSMVPNLIPVYLTLAVMGWFDIPMNISTLIIGCIVLGVAVDDTIHFMHKFNRYFEATGSSAEAVRRTLGSTGTALFATSVVLAASFSVFVFGSFNGLVHYGILATFATVVAFFADVIVAPALMVLATGSERVAAGSAAPVR